MRRQRSLLGLLLLGLTTLAYLPSLTSRFTHYDDPLYVWKRADLLSPPGWEGLAKVFDGTRSWSGEFVEFFPLRDAVYWGVFQLFGLEPTAYHVTSLLFHLAATLLLWLLFVQVGLEEKAAWLGALVFGLHPVHIESVVWIAGLKDPMFTTFMVAGLCAYQSYRTQPATWKYGVMIAALVAGFLVKSIMVALPVLLLALEVLLPPRSSWKEIAARLWGPITISGLFFAQILAIGRANSVIIGPHGGSWTSHVVLISWAQVKYLKQALLPTSYRLIYCFDPPTGWLDWRLWTAVLVFAALVALVWQWRREPLKLLFVAVYAATMAPVSNLVPFPAIMADRYIYAPTIGVCGLLALTALRLTPRTFWLVSVAVALGLTSTTASRAWVWQDEEALWEEPDLDPACVIDSAFPAAQAHFLRYLTAKDRLVGLNALERALVTPGFKDVGEQLACNTIINAAHEAAEFGGEARALQWAKMSTTMCGTRPESWNVAMLANLHKRLDLAAGAATKAWRLNKTPEAATLMWLTRLEYGDKAAAAEVTRIAADGNFKICGMISRYADEAPALGPVLGEAINSCAPILERAPPPTVMPF